MVLFGGSSDAGLLNDTLEWNGSWQSRYPAVSPSSRFHHAMAYDSRNRRVVMFGGAGMSVALTMLGDTWEWDGTTWTAKTPPRSPAPRMKAIMAFDASRGRVLLYGGSDWGRQEYFDTWEWDGTTWTEVTPATGPKVIDALMVADSGRGRPVLLAPHSQEVWEWIAGRWFLVPGSRLPSTPRVYGACAYDALRRRIVLFGGALNGNNFQPTNETWEWDSVQWTLRSTTTTPPARYFQAMAYDPVAGEILMFGGRNQPMRLGDTWTYSAVQKAVFELIGAGCPGSAGPARLGLASGGLWVNDIAIIEVTSLPSQGPVALLFGSSRSQWGALRLPFDLGLVGMPGCTLFTSIDLAAPVVNNNGSASFQIAVCNCPVLVGVEFFGQAIAHDAGANRLGLVVSNGARMRIGAK